MRTFNIFNATFEYDPEEPEGFRAGSNRMGPSLGATRLGATVYELPPGETLCPYHFGSEEEWLLVLEGRLTVRHAEGEDVMGPGDITAFPVGPAGGHKTTNKGTETVRMLMFANSDPLGYCIYPDSEKIAYWNDSSGDPRDTVRVRRGDKLDYYDGEL
jgi:uncharacterized cupin superfamily protein